MDTVTVNKADLIEKVKTNRDAHRETFLKAQDKYREMMIEELDKRLQEVRDGKRINRGFSLPEPVDYTSSYDTALEMLNWEIADSVELDKRGFQELVLNKWGWHDNFVANTSSYVAS